MAAAESAHDPATGIDEPVTGVIGETADGSTYHLKRRDGELRLAEENGTLPEDMDVDADEEDDRESDDGE
jgi:hypothetical protein